MKSAIKSKTTILVISMFMLIFLGDFAAAIQSPEIFLGGELPSRQLGLPEGLKTDKYKDGHKYIVINDFSSPKKNPAENEKS